MIMQSYPRKGLFWGTSRGQNLRIPAPPIVEQLDEETNVGFLYEIISKAHSLIPCESKNKSSRSKGGGNGSSPQSAEDGLSSTKVGVARKKGRKRAPRQIYHIPPRAYLGCTFVPLQMDFVCFFTVVNLRIKSTRRPVKNAETTASGRSWHSFSRVLQSVYHYTTAAAV